VSADVTLLIARARMEELRAVADADRLRPGRRSGPRVRPAVQRWYARLWWAARPRVAAWTPDLLGN
jgi:hypothetical protein